jgi:hypothetical protein
MLPKDFPPWQTAYWWFRRFVRLKLFRTTRDVALMLDRERAGREASPEGGVLDSQTVKVPTVGEPHTYRSLRQRRGANDPRRYPRPRCAHRDVQNLSLGVTLCLHRGSGLSSSDCFHPHFH